MAVLERSELEASPLADLHAIADQVGLDGFRRLRKADLIDTILKRMGGDEGDRAAAGAPAKEEEQGEQREPAARRRRGGGPPGAGAGAERESEGRASSTREAPAGEAVEDRDSQDRIAEGIVELLGNGSAFLRVDPPEPSDEDVYISAAQVRRCELVSGDRVSGPVRTPRRSERYPSMARVDTINGVSAEAVAEGP